VRFRITLFARATCPESLCFARWTTAGALFESNEGTSIYKVEKVDAGATLGTYLCVLAVLGLNGDIKQLALDDKVGRKLQDLELMR
jgi:hypothetical protein